MLIRLLTCRHTIRTTERRRIWLTVGQNISLGNGIATAQYKITRTCHLPMLVLYSQMWGRTEIVLTKSSLFDLRRYAPLILIPRALEMDSNGIPTRFFLEFASRVPGEISILQSGA